LWLRNVRGQECPACGEAYDIIKAVQRAMGDDLRFVFRYSPLSEAHPHAAHAAEIADALWDFSCVRSVGLFSPQSGP
jgi:protein-disulfide isomerase